MAGCRTRTRRGSDTRTQLVSQQGLSHGPLSHGERSPPAGPPPDLPALVRSPLMTAQRSMPSRGPILIVVAIVVVAVAAAGLWYLFFRPAGPAPVSLGDTPTQAA